MKLDSLPGVGPVRIKALKEAGIRDAVDLIRLEVREYRDLTSVRSIADLGEGDIAAVRVRISGEVREARARKLLITKVYASDDTGLIQIVWYNQPWLKAQLNVGRELMLYGRVEKKRGTLSLVSPTIEREASILPVYRTIAGVPAKLVRELVLASLEGALDEIPDDLPRELRDRFSLLSPRDAYREIHCPTSMERVAKARRSLAFEELLLYQILLHQTRSENDWGISFAFSDADLDAFWSSMPFAPTGAQVRTLREIAEDLRADSAMARMVQGDVGCGKTAVALGAMLLAHKSGYQSALMVPTEVLAEQHYADALRILAPHGCRVGLLTGSLTASAHREAHRALREGDWDVVIGTHALITEGVSYARLGLVITDEQHRFGVRQRTLLGEKGDAPNVLVMSATPIPRTLSFILYGDLDISVIDELPPGRKPVQTRLVPEEKRGNLYTYLRGEVRNGKQAYVVCPLVEDSEAVEARSAEELLKELQSVYLKGLRVALVHGRLKAKEKDEILESFRAGETDVLVSTTVIEVGVNVPNASIMIIENAERFGLAQLHQLRGRVGRGTASSWCFLVAKPSEKLRFLASTTDGFRVAEKDMELRGPGEWFGVRQSGSISGAAGALAADGILLKQTHDLARELLEQKSELTTALLRAAKRRFGERELHLN